MKNGEEKRQRIEEWKNELAALKEENKTLRKVVKTMLRPVVRNELERDETAEIIELISLDDGFSSIDERFNKIYNKSKIQFEDPNDDVKIDQTAREKSGILTSPYEPLPLNVQIHALKPPPKVANYKPFKRDPIKNPNFLEKEEILRQERIKERNDKILAKAEKLLLLDLESEESSLTHTDNHYHNHDSESQSSVPLQDQLIRLKISNISAKLLTRDIDWNDVVGVNLYLKVANHHYALKRFVAFHADNYYYF